MKVVKRILKFIKAQVGCRVSGLVERLVITIKQDKGIMEIVDIVNCQPFYIRWITWTFFAMYPFSFIVWVASCFLRWLPIGS